MTDPQSLPLLVPYSGLLTVVGFGLALVLLAHLLRSNRPPSSTIAWLLIIVFVPYIGVPLYLTFGGRKIRRMARKKEDLYVPGGLGEGSVSNGGIERILGSFGVPPVTKGNCVRVVTDGVEAYRELLRVIEGASRTIHVTTFVLGRDAVGEAIIARLADKARQGIEVRLLLDDVGSWRIGRRSVAPLVEAGGKVARFMPMLHVPFRGRSNLRNHRKIVVADGRVALTGGMNLAGEYLGPSPDPVRWRDLSLVVEGPAARDLDDLFRSDWEFATREGPPGGPPPHSATALPTAPPPTGGATPVQVVASGPDVAGDPLYEAIVTLLFSARKRVWVVTPYFVPNETLAHALDLAARRGVDVRLVVPYRSNHLSADLARVGYLREIHEAGARVLRYTAGMVHAKALLIDDELAVVGSANMDMRSLFLNYEVALFLFDRGQVDTLDAWFRGLFPACRPGLARQSWFRELIENVVRLLSPLL